MRTTLRLLLLSFCLQPLATFAQTYCPPSYAPAGALGDYIDGFQLETINTSSSGPTAVPGYFNTAYLDPATIARLVPGQSYEATITSGPDPTGDKHAIWVDLDQDNLFEANELLSQTTAANGANNVHTVTVNIPATAKPGYTGLRVMAVDGPAPTDPCGAYEFGETEDYIVLIDDGAPCIPLSILGTVEGEQLTGVVLGTINNVNSGGPVSEPYTDYTFAGPAFVTTLTPGLTYPLTVYSGNLDLMEHYSVWVDLDGNSTFTPNEMLASGIITVTPATLELNITIPAGTPSGYTRMRVLCTGSQAAGDPCGTYAYAETEDYAVLIGSTTQCIPLFAAGNGYGDYIESVSFGSIAHASGMDPTPYTDHFLTGPAYLTVVAPGTTQTLTVTAGGYACTGTEVEYYSVWIDRNRDGAYTPVERFAMGTTTAPGEVLQLAVNFPAELVSGYMRMRVLCSFNSEPLDGCALVNYGEAEDYTLIIDDGAPCIPPFALWNPDGNRVQRVQIADMDWQADPAITYLPYSFEGGYGAHLTAGTSYQLTLTKSEEALLDTFSVWIDVLGDGFGPDDHIGTQQATGPNGTATFTITLPFSIGYLPLRIVSGSLSGFDGCSAGPGSGNTVDFTLAIHYPGHPCIPLLGYGNTYGDGLVDLTLQGHTYTDLMDLPYYHAFSNVPHQLTPGTQEPMTITTGYYAPERYNVMLDLNDDGDFSDALEQLATAESTDPGEVLSLTLPIPANSPAGQHTLRVRSNDAEELFPDPCADALYGAIVDIQVTVVTNTGIANATATDLHVLPTTNGVQLRCDASAIGQGYTLLDATGRTVLTGRLTSDRTDLNLLPFAHGAYTVRVNSTDAHAVKRFVW